MKTMSLSLSQVYDRTVFFLTLCIVVSAFLYGMFLLMTVMHAAARQSAQVHIRDLATQVGVLETEYLQKTESITPATITQLGLVKPTVVSTVYTNADSLSLQVIQ